MVVHHAMLVPQEQDASEHEEGQLEQTGKQKLQPCPQHDQHEHIEQLKRVKQLEQQVEQLQQQVQHLQQQLAATQNDPARDKSHAVLQATPELKEQRLQQLIEHSKRGSKDSIFATKCHPVVVVFMVSMHVMEWFTTATTFISDEFKDVLKRGLSR